MRKRIVYIITLLAFSSLMMNAQYGLRPRGDVNCDWEVTIADFNALVDSIFSGAKYNSLYSYATDINGDREINIADINLLINAIMGEPLPPMPTYSGTLPVLFINTEGYRNIDSKEEYIHADWWLDNMGNDGCESIGSPQAPQGMLIKGRGNYTWTLSKKPFRIKLDTKEKLMGMKKDRHFCLLASDFWTVPLGFELSRRIGLAYTPAIEPLEVVLNGQYIGLYLLTEKIRVGKDRVNIVEQEDNDTIHEHVTGGWLLEIDGHVEEKQFGLMEGNGNWLAVTYHSPDSLSPDQFSYIYNYISETDAAVYTNTPVIAPWEEYIDIDTLACFYIVNEVADEVESFTNSLYLHKQRGDSTKLMFGPVWDFGCSFGRSQSPTPCFIYENTADYFKPHWLEELLKEPHLQLRIRSHWRHFYDNGLQSIEEYMDNWTAHITSAVSTELIRWPEYEYDHNIVYLHDYYYKPSLREKINWLQSQWGIPDNVDPNGPEDHTRNQ
jgi:hypothetical protein